MGNPIRTRRSYLLTLILAAGVGVVACQPADRSDAQGEAGEEQATASVVTTQDVIQMERSLWAMLGEGNYAAFGEKIAEDFTYPSGTGVIGKPELMSQLEGATVESYEISDFQVKQPGSNVAVVIYRFSETFRPADADSATTFTGWATSIWENRGGNWRVVLHHSSESTDSME